MSLSEFGIRIINIFTELVISSISERACVQLYQFLNISLNSPVNPSGPGFFFAVLFKNISFFVIVRYG